MTESKKHSEKPSSHRSGRAEELRAAAEHVDPNTQGSAGPRCDPGSSSLQQARRIRLHVVELAPRLGWVLTPLTGKRPKHKGWSKAPKPEVSTVKAWARAGNLGLRTGSVSGIVVIDDDSPDGRATAALDLPKTVTVVTGGGGRHFYFRAPDVPLGTSRGNLPAQIDVRGDGGQVVLPGSVHPETGMLYEWLASHSPNDVEVAPLPEHILALILGGAQRRSAAPRGFAQVDPLGRGEDAGATRLFAKHIDKLANAKEGSRNELLNKASFVAGSLVAAGRLDRAKVEKQLHETALGVGLGAPEVRRTIESGIRAGLAKPLHVRAPTANGARSVPNNVEGRSSHDKPFIVVEGGRLPEVIDQAEVAWLRASLGNCYIYADSLVRLSPSHTSAPIPALHSSGPSHVTMVPFDHFQIAEEFTKAATWLRYGPRETEPRRVDCPERIAKTYLARIGLWKAPLLKAVLHAPTLRIDGSLLQDPGYDSQSGFYLDFADGVFPRITGCPSIDDARRALVTLSGPIAKYPWTSAADEAAALAAILTVIVRRSLPQAPLFGISAPTPATGKSSLVDVISIIATGGETPPVSFPRQDDEFKKLLLSVLMTGAPLVFFDNVETSFGSSALCSALTQATWSERVLGSSRVAKVPTNATFFVTGNNLRYRGDIVSRTVPIHLDARMERPEEREFAFSPRTVASEQRPQLVAAAITVLRAYQAAGLPSQDLSNFGRFELWSRWVRSALVWAGKSDPCTNRKALDLRDVEAEVRTNVLGVLFETYKTGVFSVSTLISDAKRWEDEDDPGLKDALRQVAEGDGGRLDSQRLGHWLHAQRDRVVDGKCIVREPGRANTAHWRIAVAPLVRTSTTIAAEAASISRTPPVEGTIEEGQGSPSRAIEKPEGGEK